jgi:hypothetical protein
MIIISHHYCSSICIYIYIIYIIKKIIVSKSYGVTNWITVTGKHAAACSKNYAASSA